MVKLHSEEKLAAMLAVSRSRLALWRLCRIGPPYVETPNGIAYPSDQFAKWCASLSYEDICKLHAPDPSE